MAVVNKIIKVNMYNVSKENLETLYNSYQVQIGIGVLEEYGAHVIIVNGTMIIDDCLNYQEPISLLTNDIDLPLPLVKTNDINLVFGNGINIPEKFQLMPSFGITIDDNINIQQFNISSIDANKIFNDIIYHIWDIDGNLRSNRSMYSIDEIIEGANYILEKGYYKPLLVYIDNILQIMDYSYIYYLTNLLGLENIPIRAITYKDIKYISNICPEFYANIKSILPNKYYTQLDEENCLEHAIIDYGDKRRILQKYEKRKYIPATSMSNNVVLSYKETDWDNCIPIYYFIFDDHYSDRNANFVKGINGENYYGRTKREDGKLGNTSFGCELQSYLRTYDKFITEPIDSKELENYEYHINEIATKYEEYPDNKNLNSVSSSLFTFSYKLKNIELISKVAEHIGADLYIYANKPALINIENIHLFLQKDTLNIKYLRPKIL